MKNYLSLVLRIIVAVILLQTLRFKFLAHPDSIYIFTQVGMEPWGRIGIGVLELIASILLFLSKKIWLGAGLSAGLMTGAVTMHLTMIGIEVKGSQRWLNFYIFRLQPIEILKPFFVLLTAKLLTRDKNKTTNVSYFFCFVRSLKSAIIES